MRITSPQRTHHTRSGPRQDDNISLKSAIDSNDKRSGDTCPSRRPKLRPSSHFTLASMDVERLMRGLGYLAASMSVSLFTSVRLLKYVRCLSGYHCRIKSERETALAMSMRSFGVRLPCISGYNKIVQTYRFLLSLALDSPTAGG